MPGPNRNTQPQTQHKSGPRQQNPQQTPQKLSLQPLRAVYDPLSKQLTVTVLATRGKNPAPAVDLQLLVQDAILATGQTDATGRFTAVVSFTQPAKEYGWTVSTVSGDIATTTGSFTVPQPYELTEGMPAINFEATASQTDDGFAVVVSITARRGSSPITNTEVDIEYGPNTNSVRTDARGNAQCTLNVITTKSVQLHIRTLLIMTPLTSCSKVIYLEKQDVQPDKMSFTSNRVDTVNGIDDLVLMVEDEAGKPCKGIQLMCSTEYGTILSNAEQTTDIHGKAKFRVQVDKSRTLTDFTVDCPGILHNAEFRLERPKVHNRWALKYLPMHVGELAIAGLLICVVVFIIQLINLGLSYTRKPAVQDVHPPTAQSLRTQTEQQTYQYLTLPKTSVDTLWTDSGTYVDSAGTYVRAPQLERTDAPSAAGFARTAKAFLLLLFVAIVCILISIPIVITTLKDAAEVQFREKRSGLADNSPTVLHRLEERLSPRATQPAVAGTPAPAPAAKEGGILSHLPAVALFGVMDLIVDKFLNAHHSKKS